MVKEVAPQNRAVVEEPEFERLRGVLCVGRLGPLLRWGVGDDRCAGDPSVVGGMEKVHCDRYRGQRHIGTFGPIDIDATPEERCAAALEVALELISA